MTNMQHRLLSAVYVASQVVKGFGRGSKELGCPTANLEEDVVQGLTTLDDGIYYGFAQLLHPLGSELEKAQAELASRLKEQQQQQQQNGEKSNDPARNIVLLEPCPANPVYPMVCSLGWNPQYNNQSRTMEVHLLHDFGYDFYGSLIRVAVCGYIRPERKFDSVQALKETIQADIDFARAATERPKECWAHVTGDRFFQLRVQVQLQYKHGYSNTECEFSFSKSRSRRSLRRCQCVGDMILPASSLFLGF